MTYVTVALIYLAGLITGVWATVGTARRRERFFTAERWANRDRIDQLLDNGERLQLVADSAVAHQREAVDAVAGPLKTELLATRDELVDAYQLIAQLEEELRRGKLAA